MTIPPSLSDAKVIVISQSMYFPWCGFLDLVRLSDIFVHYDDVQLSRGFYNRVQIKTSNGTAFITVPLKKRHQNQLISQSYIDYSQDWIGSHRAVLINSYRKTRFIDDAISLFDTVHKNEYEILSELGRATIKSLLKYYGLDQGIIFSDSVNLNAQGSSSERLINITKSVKGGVYLTGHGALNYLDHNLFENNGIEVRYIDYSIEEYAQLYGTFTPYVTALDAIAHLGSNVRKILNSSTVHWREALERPEKLRA
jgi:hypothetical protein